MPTLNDNINVLQQLGLFEIKSVELRPNRCIVERAANK